MFEDYKALLNKIDLFLEGLQKRYPKSVQCKPTCCDCCVGGINVWRIEFDRIKKHIDEEKIKVEATNAHTDRCVMLNKDGLCSIYPARPAVCHLWGTPLLLSSSYASNDIESSPHNQVTLRISDEEKTLVYCNKNFSEEMKRNSLKIGDMLNADLVLTTLAAINHVYCKKSGLDPEERIAISNAL